MMQPVEVQPMEMQQPMEMPPHPMEEAQPMMMPPMAPQGMPQMGMRPMPQMPGWPQAMASWAANPSPGAMMVPVPVPVPMQMPFAMPKPAAQSVQVPPGFKLVRISDQAEAPEPKAAPVKSAISDP